jgi:hypothetical protein
MLSYFSRSKLSFFKHKKDWELSKIHDIVIFGVSSVSAAGGTLSGRDLCKPLLHHQPS